MNKLAEELNKKGFAIDKKVVSMKDIKALGEFKAVLKLKDYNPSLKQWVE